MVVNITVSTMSDFFNFKHFFGPITQTFNAVRKRFGASPARIEKSLEGGGGGGNGF